MQIQVEKLWLFETLVSDPFFLGENSGVTATMVNPRIISFLNIVTVFFLIDNIGKSGLNYSISYGGEDQEIAESYGKNSGSYEVSFNLPVREQKKIEKMIGRQFSVMGMRRDQSLFVIFGQFEAEALNVDNEVQQRVTFKAKNTNAKIFTVQSMNIEEILNTITVIDQTPLNGFDYGTDFNIN